MEKRVAKKRNVARAEQAPTSLSEEGTFEIKFPILAGTRFIREPPPDGYEEKEFSFFYTAVLRAGVENRGLCPFVCELSAGRQIGDVETFKLEASYLIGLRWGKDIGWQEKRKRQLVSELAAASAWTRFSDLYAVLANQSAEEIPPLPLFPNFTWGDPISSDE